MNRSFRPKRAQQLDRNHFVVRDALMHRCAGGRKDAFGVYHASLRGLRVVAYDMSKGGGEMTDWLCLVSWFPVFLEVKREREVADASKQKLSESERLQRLLEPGEREFLLTSPAVTAVVVNEDQVHVLLDRACDFVFAVEESTQGRDEYLRLFFPKLGVDYV